MGELGFGSGGPATFGDLPGDEERRVVTLRSLDGGRVMVAERTTGPLTREVYQGESHLHGIVTRREDLPALDADPGSPGPHLVDLMDSLDARGLAYAYFSEFEGRVVWRPGCGR